MTTLEGYLQKDGGWRRGWRKRYFKLGKIYFKYFENEGCTSPKGALVRGTIMSVEVVNKTIFQFKVVAKDTWMLQAANKSELIQWMEAIIPNSAKALIQQPIIPRAIPATSVTACEADEVDHHYQPLPDSMRNPRFSFSEQSSNEKPSPPRNRRGSAASTHSVNSNQSSNQENEQYLQPMRTSPTPPAAPTTAPPPLMPLIPLDSDEESSDEFFCFDDDELKPEYINDDETITLRRKSLKEAPLPLQPLSFTVEPDVIIESDTFTREKAQYLNEIEAQHKPEYMNEEILLPDESSKENVLLSNESYEEISPEPSPLPHRRSIKSKPQDNITYSISPCDGPRYSQEPSGFQEEEEDEKSESPPANKRSIKSAEPGPMTLNVPVSGGANSFLSTSPLDGITTLRVNEWIKNTTSLPKEFDDPDELDELDKYLLDNSMVLPREDIVLLCKIGNGAFGEVWKARADPTLNGQELVAVKTLKEGSSDKNRQDFYGEAALLGQFKHENVIALHGVILREESPFIVIEYAENGALKSFLKKYGEQRHSNQLVAYCRDIVKGMKYLSERGYIHRDLAARNVLVSRYECCKIADFGLSRKLGEEDDIYVSRGGMVAIKWTAPEAVLAASYSTQSDVWSCGVTMWEVFSVGANPFAGLANEDAFRNIRRGSRLTKPEKCPLDVYKVLMMCWESNPAERPTFAKLETLLYDPCTDNVEQPIYENSDGQLQYVNISYENMQDVEQGS